MEPTIETQSGITFENGSATLTLEQLKQTVTLEGAKGGLPKNRPIEHFALIEQTLQLFLAESKRAQTDKVVDAAISTKPATAAHTEFTIDNEEAPTNLLHNLAYLEPIHINEKYAKRIMWPSKTEVCPLDHYLIERLVCKIRIPQNEKTDQAIALSYTDDGIALAIGTNVNVCSNMNIFGSNYMSTSGNNKTPFEKMVQIIRHWAQNLMKFAEADQKIIQSLQAIELDRKLTDELIGTLIRKSVMANFTKQCVSPMNVTQVHRMIEQGGEMFTRDNFENLTAWDFTNHLTAVIKPNTNDMTTLLQTNHAVNSFVCDSFGIKYDMPQLNLN